MRRKILTLLLCVSMTATMLAGCGSLSDSEDSLSFSSSSDSEGDLSDWKKYCLTDSILSSSIFEKSADDVKYNIMDIDNNGIPEIAVKYSSSNSITGYYMKLFSFYDFVNTYDFNIKEPELTNVVDYGHEIYIYNGIVVRIRNFDLGATTRGDLWEITILKDYPSIANNMQLDIFRETEPTDSTRHLDTYGSAYADVDTNLSLSEAINKANEFLGTDIMSLPEPEFPYTYDELIEALNNY